MQISSESIRDILEHRLQQADIERLLKGLTESEKAQLVLRLSELMRRTTALIEISNRVSDTLSLNILFPRLMELVTETINADRSSLFLYDAAHDELFSRVMQGGVIGDIRFPASQGIAGEVFQSGEARIIPDAYADPHFNQEVDRRTGYHTRDIICVPIRNKKGEVIGVTQALNKNDGTFTTEDQRVLETLTTQAAAALENARLFENMQRAQREETLFLEVVSAIVSEIRLDPLLSKIVSAATTLLNADRGSLFLYDPRSGELYARVAEGVEVREIRFPSTAGIAGECFVTGQPINIPDAYADKRFNPAFDKANNYNTRTILCMPIVTKEGNKIGVMQILNKKQGVFGEADERRLCALCAQASVSLENARLFEEINNSRKYNESILRSLSNAVFTLDTGNRIIKVNEAATRLMRRGQDHLVGNAVESVFDGANGWVLKSLEKVVQSGQTDAVIDTDLFVEGRAAVSVNLTTVPLVNMNDEMIGSMLVMEDISEEKRLKNTMSRYMSKAVMDQLLEGGEAVLGGAGREVSVLFSDIRGFTSISERIGARETVALLNEYFTEMVEIVFEHNGILDKYIGDMIMAVFGSVRSREDDAENAVLVANKMMRALRALNQRRVAAGREPIRIGVGISTGQVIAGNIGSPRRLEYTVVGERVNLAERLEGVNKYFGTGVLLCEFTRSRLRNGCNLREIDLIRVRGMTTPVSVFEALDHHDEESFPNAGVVLDAFSLGLRSYRHRDWRQAIVCFKEALRAHPGDGPSRIYLDRCTQFLDLPPRRDWDGVSDL